MMILDLRLMLGCEASGKQAFKKGEQGTEP
jgi:hypothetical protein